MSQKVSPTWYKYNSVFPTANNNIAAVNGMNAALNQINGALSSFQNIAQYSNNVNQMSSLSLNAYATGLNNVAALNNAMNMVNGNGIANLANLQTLTNTGFTPTYEGERTLAQNGLQNLGTANAADFTWPSNFIGIMPDGTPYQQSVNITSNGNTELNQASFGLNMSFPTMPKSVVQPVQNSTSPTNVLSTLSSLPGQQSMFSLQTNQSQVGNGLQGSGNGLQGSGGNGIQGGGNALQGGIEFQRSQDSMNMKMMAPNVLSLRGTHQVAHGN